MGKSISLAVIAFVLSLAGCSTSSKVRTEPVSFDHPDEIIRGQGFMVLADRRVFTVMAFLNAAGFDEEIPGKQMHPVRVRVRELVAANLASCPEKLESWRRYYETHKFGTFCYQDFALSLCADYPFRRIRSDVELGYPFTAEQLRDFPEMLNDFWATAGLEAVWNQVRGDYLAEIGKYDFEKMQRQMDSLWAYLRMERRDAFILVNVPNLLDRYYHAIGAGYEGYYYSVESPGAGGHGLNVHEYLHSIINDLVQADYGAQRSKLLKYYEAGRNGPRSRSYQHPVTFAYECLVHAIDYRLRVLNAADPAFEKAVVNEIAAITQGGLTLTQPCFQLLPEFEQSGKPFDEYLPTLLEHLPEYQP